MGLLVDIISGFNQYGVISGFNHNSWADLTFVDYWSKSKFVTTKPGDHDTLGNVNPDLFIGI